MNTFQKNYWSLYLDFLKDFEKITYQGFSLPYLCHLPSYLLRNEKLINELHQPQFIKQIKNPIKNKAKIQEAFSKFVESHSKKGENQKPKGKIVFHFDKLLRIPINSIVNEFDSSEFAVLVNSNSIGLSNKNQIGETRKKKKATVIVHDTIKISKEKIQKSNELQNIRYQMIYLKDYFTPCEADVLEKKKEAIQILNTHSKHRLYREQEFKRWLLNSMESVIHYINMAKNFLNKNQVSCLVVSTTHSYINRILSVVASERGIPTVCMQHGIIASELGFIPKIAKVDAVYGYFEKNFFTQLKVPDNSVDIIGHPRFDDIRNTSTMTKSTFYKKLGLDLNWKTILMIVRGENDIDKWRTFIQSISKKMKVNILIKNYPSTKPHALTKEFTFVKPTLNLHLYEILPHVDAVVAYPSTVALEAMLCQKHVFILNKNFLGYTNYYLGLGEFVRSKPEKLARQVYQYFNDANVRRVAEEKRKKFLKHAYPSNEKSIKRLKSLIYKLIH